MQNIEVRNHFIGIFNSYDELKTYDGVKTDNDYAFVNINDDKRSIVRRYKWNAKKQKWTLQYTLKNPFIIENPITLIEH